MSLFPKRDGSYQLYCDCCGESHNLKNTDNIHELLKCNHWVSIPDDYGYIQRTYCHSCAIVLNFKKP